MMNSMLIQNSFHVILMVSMVTSQQLGNTTQIAKDISSQAIDVRNIEIDYQSQQHDNTTQIPIDVSGPTNDVKYIKIDHQLRPRRIEDINDMSPLRVATWKRKQQEKMKKYPVQKRSIQEIILEIEDNKEVDSTKSFQDIAYEMEDLTPNPPTSADNNGSWKNESDVRKSKLKSVLGTEGEVYYDADWGLMSAVLACYNNHWALKTGPEDWWTVVIRRLVQAMDEHGEVSEVRDFFVEHKGKKKINIMVGSSLSNINYDWLFSQFSDGIRSNIRVPSYVDIIENDFSSSTNEQTMISQIMLMSSMKNYFEFGMYTMCGIPGVEMKGTEDDWIKLVEKINKLEELLTPIEKHLGLDKWINTAREVFTNLLETYRGKPNIEWWVQILSWNEVWGSGMRPHWSGWFPEFLGVDLWTMPDHYRLFPSDLVTVPIHIEDSNNAPAVEDDGILVAGIVGFNVEEGGRAPVVEPMHAWSLLLPAESPVADRLTGKYPGSESSWFNNENENSTATEEETYHNIDSKFGAPRHNTYLEVLANENSTGTAEETYHNIDSRLGSTRHNSHPELLSNEGSTLAERDTNNNINSRLGPTRHITRHHKLNGESLTGIQVDPSSRVNIRHTVTRHNTTRIQHTNFDLTRYNNRRHHSTRHRTHHQQLAERNPTKMQNRTNYDTVSRPPSTGYSNHSRQLANKKPIFFSEDTISHANTTLTSIMTETVPQTEIKSTTKISCKYYCKRQDNKYSCCREKRLRKLAKRSNASKDERLIVTREDSDGDMIDICKHRCQRVDGVHFCCSTADDHALSEYLNA